MSELRYHALVAEFAEADQAVAAARQLRDSGFPQIEVYSPYALEAIDQPGRARGFLLPAIVCAGALIGAVLGYFVQYWAATDYPVNVGGRPLDSWPAFVVSAFEVAVLGAIAAGFVGFLAGARLLLFYHPVAAAESFRRASQDRFVLSIEASEPPFAAERVRAILAQHGAARIDEVRA